MTDKQLTVDLYIRVSTDRQAKEGDSLEEQESELKKFCDYRNFKIHQVLIEKGKSGGNTNRPEYKKLVADIEAKKINAVVVKKLDRLSRSLLDFEQLMTRLQEKEVEFISLRENFDTTTAMGKAMLRIALVFAQLEREQTSERISDVMHYRATQGQRNGGVAPFGYVSANKELLISNAQKPIVEQIFKLFLETASTSAVANHLNDARILLPGGKVWRETRVEWILKNPIYKGMVIWKKEIYPGLHQPIISPSVWDQVQDIFDSKKRHAANNHSFALLQKSVICAECQNPLTPSFAYNRTKTKYWYYRCGSTKHGQHSRKQVGCSFKYISFIKLHLAFQDAIRELSEAHHMTDLDTKITAHNDALLLSIKELSDQIKLYEDEVKSFKSKKIEYIDALVLKQFSTQDHQKIHERINELETDIKKHSSQISQNQLEIVQLNNQLLTSETIKETLLKLRDTSQDQPEYKVLLQKIIQTVEVSSKELLFHFKTLPWTVKITINSS